MEKSNFLLGVYKHSQVGFCCILNPLIVIKFRASQNKLRISARLEKKFFFQKAERELSEESFLIENYLNIFF